MEMLTLLENRKGKKLLPVLSNQNSDIAIELTNDSRLKDIKFRVGEYERVGMKEKVKKLKSKYSEIATAIILKKYNMKLLKIIESQSFLNKKKCYAIKDLNLVNDIYINDFEIEKLEKSIENIPENILKSIPDNFAKRKVYIAKQPQNRDPYIIAHLKDDYFVAFYWWE